MNISEIFGVDVFNDEVMKARLPEDVYKALKTTREEGTPLDVSVAQVVANAMKDWAIEKGATHYTHWFQPLNGITAEKHDSFLCPDGEGGAILTFSGKELTKGEPDASSFPSGGLRATFEARGYTAWDPTSYAFIKDGSLCIPTAFCSFGGHALDKKTPLLRSVDAVSKASVRILRLFGDKKVKRVFPMTGAEQEYFLVDKKLYEKREDLMLTGRTLFGQKPPKGQELLDHYFGAIRTRVSDYMKALDEELWKLGIYAKTKHNETAPSQHELAPHYTTTNVAADHNQLTMEIMKKVAERHGLVCLLHEKPFEGVNGSGKHNNWSLETDTGVNLLEPGLTPGENAKFMLFLSAVIQAVDEYQDLLRISVASAGNDRRLGANEAPPAVVSMFVGDELQGVLDAICSGETYHAKKKKALKLGVDALPDIPADTTDRNRTSPFAFTGNKFEFRMVGASMSISDANTVINTAVADALTSFADTLEGAKDFNQALNALVADTVKKHRRILFSGNNYAKEWEEEAASRGLVAYRLSSEAIPHLMDEKNVALFTRHKVFTKEELEARTAILLENYVKTISIEALTMVDMAKREIYPAVNRGLTMLGATLSMKKTLIKSSSKAETALYTKLSNLGVAILESTENLEDVIEKGKAVESEKDLAAYYADAVLPAMEKLRTFADEAEGLTEKATFPMPTYSDLLFGV